MFYPLILPGRTDPEAAAAAPFEAKLAENRKVIKILDLRFSAIVKSFLQRKKLLTISWILIKSYRNL